MMLSLDTAYRSFGGEVEASSTPTICRLSDSRRHQLWAIAPVARVRRSVFGTFQTCPPILRMSVHWGRPEGAVVRANRREWTKPELRGKPGVVSFSPRACSPGCKRNHFFRD